MFSKTVKTNVLLDVVHFTLVQSEVAVVLSVTADLNSQAAVPFLRILHCLNNTYSHFQGGQVDAFSLSSWYYP